MRKKVKKEEKKRKKGQEGLLCFMLFSVERQRCCDSITKKKRTLSVLSLNFILTLCYAVQGML